MYILALLSSSSNRNFFGGTKPSGVGGFVVGGFVVGACVGISEGEKVGAAVGFVEGEKVGGFVFGIFVGIDEGEKVGGAVGFAVGEKVDGAVVGVLVGISEGEKVGAEVGLQYRSLHSFCFFFAFSQPSVQGPLQVSPQSTVSQSSSTKGVNSLGLPE
jgi:hypothetical protein